MEKTFGEILKARREAASLSQSQLAGKSGVPVGTIRNLEQGHRADPRWSTVCDLADALGISVADFREAP